MSLDAIASRRALRTLLSAALLLPLTAEAVQYNTKTQQYDYSSFLDICTVENCVSPLKVSHEFNTAQGRARDIVNGGASTYKAATEPLVKFHQAQIESLQQDVFAVYGWPDEFRAAIKPCMAKLGVGSDKTVDEFQACAVNLDFDKDPRTKSFNSATRNGYKDAMKAFARKMREASLSIKAIEKNYLVKKEDIDALNARMKQKFKDWGKAMEKPSSWGNLEKARSTPSPGSPLQPIPDIWPTLEMYKRQPSPRLPAKPAAAKAPPPAPPKPRLYDSCVDWTAKDDVLIDSTMTSCVFQAGDTGCKTEMGKTFEESCRMIENLNLVHFDKEILKSLHRPTMKTYVDLVRMSALTRALEAHRMFVGHDPASLPAGCQRFGEGIAKFQKTPLRPIMKQMIKSPAEIQQAAREAKKAMRFLDHFEHEPGPWCRMGKGMDEDLFDVSDKISKKGSEGIEYWPDGTIKHEAKGAPCQFPTYPTEAAKASWMKRLHEILDEVPLLRVDHQFNDGLHHHFPYVDRIAGAKSTEDLDKAVGDAKAGLEITLQATMSSLCMDSNPLCDPKAKIATNDPCRNTDTIEEKRKKNHLAPMPASILLNRDDLTGPILKEIRGGKSKADAGPYETFDACAKKLYRNPNDTADQYAAAAVGGLCMVTAFTPAVVVTGPLCAAGFVANSLNNWNEARLHAEFVNQCRTTGGQICTSDDEKKAFTEYRSSVDDLYLNSAFAGVEAVGGVFKAAKFVGQLRKAELSADEMRDINGFLERYKKFSQANKTAEADAEMQALAAKYKDRLKLGDSMIPEPVVAGLKSHKPGSVSEYFHLKPGSKDAKRLEDLLARIEKEVKNGRLKLRPEEEAALLDEQLRGCTPGL